jgi:ubiquinone/menaquinone biosynthesis C-methylase UbiE
MNDPVAAYFEKLPEVYRRQFAQGASGANFNFNRRLVLACELASASAGRLLDCAAGTGEIMCALLKSGRFSHATVVDIAPAMLQSAKQLVTSEIADAELEFVRSDVFNFKPSDSSFDLILCLGLIAHVGRLDILLPHLKSMLASGGRILLQTTLTDHVGARIVRAVTAQRELAQRGYRISWFSQRDIADACRGAGLRIVEMRRHSLGIPFGDRLWPWANFQLETRLQKWSSRHGADAIYLLAPNFRERETPNPVTPAAQRLKATE